MMTRTIQRYGWRADLPDHRDFTFAQLHRPAGPLPKLVDLRPHCSPVEDQGDLGSCTGNALAGAVQFLELKDKVGAAVNVSRLFIYYNERAIEGTISEDSGAQIRDGIKSLVAEGVCSEFTWPYDVANFATTPPPDAYAEALTHTVTAYARLQTLQDMRNCLAAGFPFVFGFTVYESFESDAVATTGVVNMPQPSERAIGGHAVMAAGYDDNTKRLLVRNSWGPGWGQGGYFTMPYAYVTHPGLADDFWTIRREVGF
jgi:C1A family cysteine protease